MKTTVIYHSADFDGLFCREIARKFLPDAELIGWDFKDEPLPIPAGQIYILDLPVDRVFGFQFIDSYARIDNNAIWEQIKGRIIWIDHHKSSIESHPKEIPGYRIDGVAACRLAWQWFTNASNRPCTCETPHSEGHYDYCLKMVMPTKEEYVARKVSEPLAVRLAGEYDIFDRRDPNAELFQHGLRSMEITERLWGELLTMTWKPTVSEIENIIVSGRNITLRPDGTAESLVVGELLRQGKFVQFARDNEYRDVITQQGFDVRFEGINFLACNSHECDIRSQLFEAGIKPHHEALMGFTFTGKFTDKAWRVSMYHIEGREQQPDILAIAKKFGGGGHPGACGFHLPELPFLP